MAADQITEKHRFIWQINRFIKNFDGYDSENSNSSFSENEMSSDFFEIIIGTKFTKWNFSIIRKKESWNFFLEQRERFYGKINMKVAIKTAENKFVPISEPKGVSKDFEYKGCFSAFFKNISFDFFKDKNIFDEDLKYLCDDNLILYITLEFTQKSQSDPRDQEINYNRNLCEILENCFQTGIFSDVTITSSDGKKFLGHRCILANRSEVFERMLKTEMMERKFDEIIIKDIDWETIHELLRFIYTNKVENLDALALNLFYAAEKYNIPDLKSICSSAIIKQISEQTIFDILMIADNFKEKRLLDECIEYIAMNIDILENRNEWKNIENRLIVKIMSQMPKIFCDAILLMNES